MSWRWWPAAILFAALVLSGCSRNVLYSGLTEQQANEVQAALLSAQIRAEKRSADDGRVWAIHIDTSDVPRALEILRARNLPREHFTSIGREFEKRGVVSSPSEERARYQHALEQSLSDTLSRIDGVIDARVHVALAEKHPLVPSDRGASASVVIFELPGSNVRERQTDIQAIVTDGVEGLDDPNRVTVKVFTRSQPEVLVATAVDEPRVQTRLSTGNASVLLIGVGFLMLFSLSVLAWSNRSLLRRMAARNGGKGTALKETST